MSRCTATIAQSVEHHAINLPKCFLYLTSIPDLTLFINELLFLSLGKKSTLFHLTSTHCVDVIG